MRYPLDERAYIELARAEKPDLDKNTIELLEVMVRLVNEAYYKGLQDGQKTR